MRPQVETLESRQLFSAAAVQLHAIEQPPQIVYPNITSTSAPVYSINLGFYFSGATPAQLDSIDPKVVVKWGDGHTDRSTGGAVWPPGEFLVSRLHTYVRPGRYVARVRLSGDAVGTEKVVVLVHPTTPGGLKLKAIAGRPFSGTVGGFSVQSTRYSPAPNLVGSPDVFLDWGDGVTTTPALSQTSDGTYVASGTHVYARPGRYLVKLIYWESTTPLGPVASVLGMVSTIKVRRA